MSISVIIPVYNTAKYIEKCLDSILNQTYKDIEIIIVNDGSTDNSEKIIKKYLNKYSNIKYFYEENKGQASARNLALTKASGKYITFLDSDDYIDSNMFKTMIDNACDNDIIICDILMEDNKKYILKTYNCVKDDPGKNYITSYMGPVAKLYKKSFLEKNKFKFIENIFYEDLASIAYLGMYTKKIKYIEKPFYHYVIRNGSTMKQKKYNKHLEDIFYVINHLSEKINSNSYKDELEYLYIEHLLYSSSLRFIKYNRLDMLYKINEIIRKKYPLYKKNIYYKNKSIKFRIICNLIYNKQYKILKVLTKGR